MQFSGLLSLRAGRAYRAGCSGGVCDVGGHARFGFRAGGLRHDGGTSGTRVAMVALVATVAALLPALEARPATAEDQDPATVDAPSGPPPDVFEPQTAIYWYVSRRRQQLRWDGGGTGRRGYAGQ